jgi:hypothetical protein
MDIFTFHHQPQWILSHFTIIPNGYIHIFLSTIIRIIILTRITDDIFPPFKPCYYIQLNMTSVLESKLPFNNTHFLISLFRDLPPGINFLVSLSMQALLT